MALPALWTKSGTTPTRAAVEAFTLETIYSRQVVFRRSSAAHTLLKRRCVVTVIDSLEFHHIRLDDTTIH